MAIPSGLLGKGLFGLCLIGSGTTGFVFGRDIVDWATGVTALLSELKIPEGCKARGKVCEVSEEKFKKILFKNKEDNQDLTITGIDTNANVKLKIEKGQDTKIFPHGLKFTLLGHDKDLEIKKSSDGDTDKITVKANTNTEFKVNNKRLEKAWTADAMAKKVGLKGCNSNGDKKCTIEANKAISYSVDGNKIKKLTISGNDDSEKITYSENEAEYNQGFKFSVSSQITGTSAAAGTSSEQLDANTNYEVKFKEGNDGGWYLSKKTTS